MPIEFNCPRCGASLSLWDELAGRQGTCPECKQAITVPDPRLVVSMMCPHCEAEIPADAIICTSCGRDLKSGERLETRVNEPGAVEQIASESVGAAVDFLWRHKFLIVGLAAFLAIVLLLFSLVSKKSIGPDIEQLDRPRAAAPGE